MLLYINVCYSETPETPRVLVHSVGTEYHR